VYGQLSYIPLPIAAVSDGDFHHLPTNAKCKEGSRLDALDVFLCAGGSRYPCAGLFITYLKTFRQSLGFTPLKRIYQIKKLIIESNEFHITATIVQYLEKQKNDELNEYGEKNEKFNIFSNN
jgi:hypothetical protein